MTDRPAVELAERGRMIAVLRRQRVGNPGYNRNTRRYEQPPRRWTDAEIRAALHLGKAEFTKALKAYSAQAQKPPNTWSRDALAEKVLAFARKRKRWPTNVEMDRRSKELDIPARSTIARHFPSSSWNGPSVFDQLVTHMVDDGNLFERLTPQLILAIRNVTVRRRAMEKYGVERLLREGGGERVQQDSYGTLWRLPSDNPTDDHAQWVEVVNATPEPDGTSAHYFLRVPPSAETAKDAVAWTFDLANPGLRFVRQGQPVLRRPQAQPEFDIAVAT